MVAWLDLGRGETVGAADRISKGPAPRGGPAAGGGVRSGAATDPDRPLYLGAAWAILAPLCGTPCECGVPGKRGGGLFTLVG